MEIKMLAQELEQWAKEITWKQVAQLVTEHHNGDLLVSLVSLADAEEFGRQLHNNTQIIQRAFRNDTPNYRKQAVELAAAVRFAMDAERGKRMATQYLAANATRECVEATNAVLLGKPHSVIQKEAIEAIYSLAEFLPGMTVQLVRTSQQPA
ncbi:hypothetical protein GJV07_02035 [Enterobacteriaceae bacterium RIT711]|nr:hypothetical protein [Enterobacteriaceae bacterium RIT711]